MSLTAVAGAVILAVALLSAVGGAAALLRANYLKASVELLRQDVNDWTARAERHEKAETQCKTRLAEVETRLDTLQNQYDTLISDIAAKLDRPDRPKRTTTR